MAETRTQMPQTNPLVTERLHEIANRLAGRRGVRGREHECREYSANHPDPSPTTPTGTP